MKIENLSDLFLHTLKDIYFAENQIVKALPKMVEGRRLQGAGARVRIASGRDQGADHPS